MHRDMILCKPVSTFAWSESESNEHKVTWCHNRQVDDINIQSSVGLAIDSIRNDRWTLVRIFQVSDLSEGRNVHGRLEDDKHV